MGKVQTRVPDELAERIDEYQEQHGYMNEAEAVRALLRAGLNADRDTSTSGQIAAAIEAAEADLDEREDVDRHAHPLAGHADEAGTILLTLLAAAVGAWLGSGGPL